MKEALSPFYTRIYFKCDTKLYFINSESKNVVKTEEKNVSTPSEYTKIGN